MYLFGLHFNSFYISICIIVSIAKSLYERFCNKHSFLFIVPQILNRNCLDYHSIQEVLSYLKTALLYFSNKHIFPQRKNAKDNFSPSTLRNRYP